VDGKFKKTDNVRSAFNRLLKKLEWKGKSFKVLRKTGASMLNTHEQHRHSRFRYLGHSDKSIADKHYAAPGRDLFNEAVLWLGRQLKIE